MGTNPSFKGNYGDNTVYTKPINSACLLLGGIPDRFSTRDSQQTFVFRVPPAPTSVRMYMYVGFDPNVRVEISYEPVRRLSTGAWVAAGTRVMCSRMDIYGTDNGLFDRTTAACTRRLAATFTTNTYRVIFKNVGLSATESPAPPAQSPPFSSYGSVGYARASICMG